ncbi:MAG: hypothetical protein R2862_05000 [Thermoanaerobaculia bacterium]
MAGLLSRSALPDDGPVPPLAAEIEVSTTVGQALGPAQLRIEGGEIHLTIEEAIRLAIEAHPGDSRAAVLARAG